MHGSIIIISTSSIIKQKKNHIIFWRCWVIAVSLFLGPYKFQKVAYCMFFAFQTTLAHIIASTSKKNGTARFVTLSATSASTNEVREVIKQAQNELRLCKRKTILFIDEIHRFNKSQQVEYRGRKMCSDYCCALFVFIPHFCIK